MKVERSISETFHVDNPDQIPQKSKLPMIRDTQTKRRIFSLTLREKRWYDKFTFKDIIIWHGACRLGHISIIPLTDGNFRLVCTRCAMQTIVLCPDETIHFINVACNTVSTFEFKGAYADFKLQFFKDYLRK